MPAPDLIIFDCDGVLIDSEMLSADALIAELAVLGVAVDRAYVRMHFLGRSFPTVAQSIRESFRLPLPDDFEARYRSRLLARFEADLRPTTGIEALLETLAIAKCVATSSSPQRVARSLQISGLDRFFGASVFTASQVAKGKPAPDLFLFAAAQMGADPARTLVIEDSRPGVEAALAAAMPVLIYAGGQHMRDHRFETSAPVAVFDNWADFPHLLQNLTVEKGIP
jgi:HAD superfamily hydrolase (TIGR01509 family)